MPPLSIGGCAFGLLPFGGCAVGVIALGGICAGVWSIGGLAFGWQAFGGCAIAWNAALGGTAIAREFALGGIAHALQANNKIAANFIDSQALFQHGKILMRYYFWLNLLWVVPMIFWWRCIGKARKNSGKRMF